jgi:hypothetical protein
MSNRWHLYKHFKSVDLYSIEKKYFSYFKLKSTKKNSTDEIVLKHYQFLKCMKEFYFLKQNNPLCQVYKVGYYTFPFYYMNIKEFNKRDRGRIVFNFKDNNLYLRLDFFFVKGKYSMWIREYKKGSNQLTNQIQISDCLLDCVTSTPFFYDFCLGLYPSIKYTG